MLHSFAFEYTVIGISLAISTLAYFLIAGKDESFVNWSTSSFVLAVGQRYLFQTTYIYYFSQAGGSRYAYIFTYTLYALSSLAGALAYCYLKPLRLPSVAEGREDDYGRVAWFCLVLGCLLYSPILIKFHQYILSPRRIYELTRTGYGVWFLSSVFFANIALVFFLFIKRKKLRGSVLFVSIIAIQAYLHGSKGMMFGYVYIWILYRIYILHKRVGLVKALIACSLLGSLIIGIFALFANTANLQILGRSLSAYDDGTRNAMLVIDDPHEDRSYGRILFEGEFYARVPRQIVPSKPKDFGSFELAHKYNPAQYRNDEGTASFDIGTIYADFGPGSLIFSCLGSIMTAWLLAAYSRDLNKNATPERFMIFLFLAGVSVIPLGGVWLLPETILLAAAIRYMRRFRLIRQETVVMAPPLSAEGR